MILSFTTRMLISLSLPEGTVFKCMNSNKTHSEEFIAHEMLYVRWKVHRDQGLHYSLIVQKGLIHCTMGTEIDC
jgi:hypothetical protein